METFERIVKIAPAFDKRNPQPSKDYGIHNAEMYMVLKGALGAVIFSMSTGWFLPHVHDELVAKGSEIKPRGMAVAYCSPKPMSESQADYGKENCDWLGCTCYGDVSYLISDEVLNILITEGSEQVWKWLENYYNETFNPSFPEQTERNTSN